MAGKERGLFRLIFRDFIRSITPSFSKTVCVGEDYMGTKYYEIIVKTQSIHKKPNRYFVPVNKDNFEQELPAEWESWLRNRRKLPPTEGEVQEGYEMILTKRKNAAELEITYAKEKNLDIYDPNAKPPTQHASLNFPVYDEYKGFGRGYVPKRRK